HDQVQQQAGAEHDRPRYPPVEQDHREQQDRADHVQRPGGVDRRRGMGRSQQSHRDLDGKRGEEQLQVAEAQVAEPADVTANQHGDGQRRGDDSEKEEHYPEAVAFRTATAGESSRNVAIRMLRKANPKRAATTRNRPPTTNTIGAPKRSLMGPARAMPARYPP